MKVENVNNFIPHHHGVFGFYDPRDLSWWTGCVYFNLPIKMHDKWLSKQIQVRIKMTTKTVLIKDGTETLFASLFIPEL